MDVAADILFPSSLIVCQLPTAVWAYRGWSVSSLCQSVLFSVCLTDCHFRGFPTIMVLGFHFQGFPIRMAFDFHCQGFPTVMVFDFHFQGSLQEWFFTHF